MKTTMTNGFLDLNALKSNINESLASGIDSIADQLTEKAERECGTLDGAISHDSYDAGIAAGYGLAIEFIRGLAAARRSA
jgi:hypothetical protein